VPVSLQREPRTHSRKKENYAASVGLKLLYTWFTISKAQPIYIGRVMAGIKSQVAFLHLSIFPFGVFNSSLYNIASNGFFAI